MTQYTNFDSYLDEVEGLEQSDKGFELFNERFDLPAVLPAKLMLKLSRLGDSDQDNLRGMDLVLRTMLGDEQYERVLDLVPDIVKLNALATKILEMYKVEQRPNASRVQRNKKR